MISIRNLLEKRAEYPISKDGVNGIIKPAVFGSEKPAVF